MDHGYVVTEDLDLHCFQKSVLNSEDSNTSIVSF